MTDAALDRLVALHKSATATPWAWEEYEDGKLVVFTPGMKPITLAVVNRSSEYWRMWGTRLRRIHPAVNIPEAEANAKLIVEMRNMLPRLLRAAGVER